MSKPAAMFSDKHNSGTLQKDSIWHRRFDAHPTTAGVAVQYQGPLTGYNVKTVWRLQYLLIEVPLEILSSVIKQPIGTFTVKYMQFSRKSPVWETPRQSHTWPLVPWTKSIKKHFTLFLTTIFTYTCRPANQRMIRKKMNLCSCLE